MCYFWSMPISGYLVLACMLPANAPQRSYRLPSTDLKDPVIWGSIVECPGGTGLAFGGQDQRADDGQPHTRILVKEKWQSIHEDLRSKNPLQKFHDRCSALGKQQKEAGAFARFLCFEDIPAEAEAKRIKDQLLDASLIASAREWRRAAVGRSCTCVGNDHPIC